MKWEEFIEFLKSIDLTYFSDQQFKYNDGSVIIIVGITDVVGNFTLCLGKHKQGHYDGGGLKNYFLNYKDPDIKQIIIDIILNYYKPFGIIPNNIKKLLREKKIDQILD